MRKFFSLFFSVLLFVSFAKAQQTADVTITLNEKFFDALLDAVFTNLEPPSFPLAELQEEKKMRKEEEEIAFHNLKMGSDVDFLKTNFGTETIANRKPQIANYCDESIRLMREIDGVRTAVRFRDGKISAPIAFTGSYNPPLIGCLGFEGWADSTIELEFDQNSQTLIGRAKVSDVRLSGTGGIGSSLITRLVQSSIDKKINPIRILQMDKVSFVVPVQNSGSLKMKAVGMRHEIVNGAMNVHITYQFSKG
jgi:hypothetical protein